MIIQPATPSIWDTLTGTWANDDYHFDEFMVDCQALGSEPVLSVAMDGIYKPPTNGYESLTKQEAIDMAVAWVRYANVTNDYNIKYWLIGNETWNGDAYNGGTFDGFEYGRDVADFARAMKAVDPDILIGINGNSQNYFEAALSECVADVDFLDVHTYPCFGFDEYRDYETRNIDPLGVITVAQRAINSQAAADRNRLFIALTETSAFGYAGGEWNQGNNIGQALANTDIFGQLAGDDRLRFFQFWNTHWVKEDTGISNGEDFFFKDNTLNATGRLLSRFTREMRDEIVGTTSSGPLRVFATRSSDAEELTVFIINKSTTSESVKLSLSSFTPASTVTRSEFAGASVTDPDPTYADLATLAPSGNVLSFAASPLSLTILRASSQDFIADCTANRVTNSGFESGDFTGWQTSANGTTAFTGVQDRSGDGFAYEGSFIAFAGGNGEAEISQVITGLAPNTAYLFSTFINYYTEEGTPTPAILGVRDYGGTAMSTEPYARQDFIWREITIPFTTGPSASQAEIFMNVNGTNVTYAWLDAASLVCDSDAQSSLPVTLLSFEGQRHPTANELQWRVNDERDLDHYALEASTDGRVWKGVATVSPRNITDLTYSYSVTDLQTEHQLYRLRSTDFDGTSRISDIVALPLPDSPAHAAPYPNPARNAITLPANWLNQPYRMTDALGRVQRRGILSTQRLSLTGLPPGAYYLTAGRGASYRILKQ